MVKIDMDVRPSKGAIRASGSNYGYTMDYKFNTIYDSTYYIKN